MRKKYCKHCSFYEVQQDIGAKPHDKPVLWYCFLDGHWIEPTSDICSNFPK